VISAPAEVAPAAPLRRSDLGAQIGALDRARAALRDGDAARCLSLLAEYDRAFPAGVMAQEAVVLRVEALLRLGDRDRARDVAARFLASHPTSPHAETLGRLVDTNP
jgi:hypothetical protein